MTNNAENGPVASYTAPGFNSCSFFSNLSIDPSDRFLLSGSSNGQAYIWDTLSHPESDSKAFELPVFAQLEVSKTAWAGGRKGSLDAQIACISDDLTFSLFNWNLRDEQDSKQNITKRPKVFEGRNFREIIYRNEPLIKQEEETVPIKINQGQISSNVSSSIPVTPIRKRPSAGIIGTPPNSANKSILDFFSRSPRVEPRHH